MKIGSITLHNFKCFEGTCSINGLADGLDSQERIVLFGGLNGAGKTTLFESILLCLYGKRNKTLWPSKGTKREDYQNYIVAVTNNHAKRKAIRSDMWIDLELQDIERAGIAQSLSVKRYWTIDTQANTIYNENLTIYDEKGKPFDFVSENDWEEFINELIPYEISQFFFFDGEKIQDFVKDEDKEFADSLEKVLGISLYEQLNTDLEEVRRRILRRYNEDEDAKIRLTEIEKEIAECEKIVYKAEESINSLKEEIKEIEERIEEIDIETRRITRVRAQTLEEYRAEKTKLIEDKVIHEEKIFEAIQDDIPLLITAPLCRELVEQLINEERLNEILSAQKALEPKIRQITRQLFEGKEPSPPLLQQQKKFYAKKLRKILSQILAEKPKGLENVFSLHNLAKNNIEQIQSRIQRTYEVVNTLVTHLNQLQEIEPKLKKISQTEQKALDPEASRLYEEKGKLLEKLQIKNDEIENLRIEIDIQRGQIASKKRQRTEYENKVARTIQMQNQIEYTKRLREVLDEFSHRLRAKKVDKLQQYTLKMWNKLAHKKDQIKNININPDRQFSIELFDVEDKQIDKTKLSAGEKELLAISLIWSLSKLANRNLPVVIDTPLGRLDTIHRSNIAKHYFSNASHQVLLLSTNTEIIGKEYEAIKKFVSKKYILQRDKAQEASRISEGYFE
ncbi:MAG: DNA sulfur modification protein DndD [Candidatus Heimdallarchaeota archaeon]